MQPSVRCWKIVALIWFRWRREEQRTLLCRICLHFRSIMHGSKWAFHWRNNCIRGGNAWRKKQFLHFSELRRNEVRELAPFPKRSHYCWHYSGSVGEKQNRISQKAIFLVKRKPWVWSFQITMGHYYTWNNKEPEGYHWSVSAPLRTTFRFVLNLLGFQCQCLINECMLEAFCIYLERRLNRQGFGSVDSAVRHL